MSESSRSRVTITLGRSGQVVKRNGNELDSSFTDLNPNVGSKRSVRERLGNIVESSSLVNNKRQRGDGRIANNVSDLSKGDLRYKLMQKNMLKQSRNSQQSSLDLRNILSRPAQSSTNSILTRERTSESKNTRLQQMEPMGGRQQHFTETRDGRHLLPVTRSSSQHTPDFRVDNALNPRKRSVLDAMEGGRSFLEASDVRRYMPEPSNPGMLPKIPGTRPSNSMTRMESGVSSHSPWTLDSLRQRSPDESLTASRSLAAPGRDEVSQRRYVVKAYDDARTSSYLSKDDLAVSRPMSSSLAKMAPPIGQLKPMAPVAPQRPLSGSFVQKSSYMVDDQLTVDSFLRSLGLEKYTIIFKAEEVDMYSLRRMTERDLKELGIPMGPRKKILLSLQPHLKQQA